MFIQTQLNRTAGLVGAVDAVRNWRAGLLMILSVGLAGLVFALGGVLSVRVHLALGLPFFLLGLAIAFYGANAVGVMMMDEAGGGKSRPMLAAILGALATAHRLALVVLMVMLVYVLGLVAMALLLFLCKLPGLGPLLFTVVFPACAVASGLAVFAMYAVVGPLAAPAVWAGATAMQTMSRLAAIARQRIVTVIISMLVLFIVVGLVAGILIGILFAGSMITGMMAASIVHAGGVGLGGLMQMIYGGGEDGGGSSYLAAGALGGGLVWTMALTLPALVYMRGCCQVYLANIEGVNVEAVEQQLRNSLESARRKAAEIREQGAAGARQEPALAAGPSGTLAACPSCGSACAHGDVFCGNCGHKLA